MKLTWLVLKIVMLGKCEVKTHKFGFLSFVFVIFIVVKNVKKEKRLVPCLCIMPPCIILATIHRPSSFILRVIPYRVRKKPSVIICFDIETAFPHQEYITYRRFFGVRLRCKMPIDFCQYLPFTEI